MRTHEGHQPGPEIEITLAKGEIRWQVLGEDVSHSTAFNLQSDTLDKLRQSYEKLVNLSRTEGDGDGYKEHEKTFGDELAGLLLRNGERDNELAATLNRLLRGLPKEQYVRLLLRFEDPNLARVPWELTLWKSRETGKEICLGRHGDIALSRLERARSTTPDRRVDGQDRILSTLNIGTELHTTGVFCRTAEFIRLIDERVPRVHAASLQAAHLKQYWVDCFKLLRRRLEIDIVHWNGHGSSDFVEVDIKECNSILLSAADLIERTQGAFLYVVQSCYADGETHADKNVARYNTFSSALLDHGASAVLSMHDGVYAEDFEHLPILYALLVQGLPLDYCVQFMRRYFWNDNVESQNGPYEPWFKLLLRTNCVSYLDGTSAALPWQPLAEILILDALVPAYEQLLAAGRCGDDESETDEDESCAAAAPVKVPADNPADGERERGKDEKRAAAAPVKVLAGKPPAAAGDAPARDLDATLRAAAGLVLQRLYDTALMK